MVTTHALVPLTQVPLFDGLTDEEIGALSRRLQSRHFPAGASIIDAEQPGEVAYVVLDGTVKVQIDRADGTEVILAILRAGEVIGEMSLVDSLGRSANVITMEPTAVAWMPRAAFWVCLREMPAMTFNLVGILSRRLRLANGEIESLARLDVEGRIARQLLDFAAEYGEPASGEDVMIPIRLTQTDLAALVGASRVRVNQVLGDYRRRGLIAIDDLHRITVRDREALARECG